MADTVRRLASPLSPRGCSTRPWRQWAQLLPVVLCACASMGATHAAPSANAASRSRPEGLVVDAEPPALTTSTMFRSLRWRNIGPFRGGRSVAVAGDVSDPAVYYMGGTGGGVWKTDDAGAHWRNVSDGQLGTGSVGAIGVAPSASNVVYVGMGEHAVRGVMSSHGDGVYKSTDGGTTWTHQGLRNTRHISDVIVHPHDPSVVYVSAQGTPYAESPERGVYKTVDGGNTWRRVLYVDESTGASALSMDPNNPDVLYAGMWQHRRHPWHVKSGPKSAIYKSTDGGKSWTKLTDDLPKSMGKIGLSVSAAKPGLVYANIEAADDKGGVYRSDDGGKSWKHVNKDRIVQTRSWYYMEIFADPRHADTVYVLNAPLLKSTDGGKTFRKQRDTHGDHHDLWINPDNPDNMINGNDGGATITFNGGATWSTQDNQPTGQFYRVNVDHRFPYHVYGGQQDNSAIAVSSRNDESGLGDKDWYSVGGCESAFVAFDANDPRFVAGGCYQGGVSVFDHTTRQAKDIEAYPADPFGTLPRDKKYRFNWNAPLLVSARDSRVMYHAAQMVLRSQDRGQSWAPMSPDLTRNESDKQGQGGGPITNEAAGGENYNTISYLFESPHEAGVLWAGSDDGRIQLTRDHGGTWRDVTPKGVKDGIVNAIDVSPHDPATAYVTVMRYKYDDLRAYIYRTQNYGRSWVELGKGLPDGAFARVVREDPQVAGLLYAGTELGLFVSFDAGKGWHRLESNFPVTPVTDLAIHDNDLVAATAGRGFWILDDLGALQQSRGAVSKEFALFVPKQTVRFGPAIDPKDRPLNQGDNLAGGMLLDYYLPQKLDDDENLRLSVLDEAGQVIREFSSQADEDFKKYEGGPSEEPRLPTAAGVNRFVWDLRRAPLAGVPDVFIMGSYRGSRVGPGRYRVRMSLGKQSREAAGQVVADPRLSATAEDFAQQQAMIDEVCAMHNAAMAAIVAVREAKAQLESHQRVFEGQVDKQDLAAQGKAVLEALSAWEERIVSVEQKTWQDVINYPNRLAAQFIYLKEQLDSADPRPTQGARQRLTDLRQAWNREQAALRELLARDLAAYSKAYSQRGLPVITLPAAL